MIESLSILIMLTLILSSSMVVLSSNSLYSALFLILSYLAAAITLLLLKSEFIALILIIVYISAVIVLFLFVILMIDIKNYLVTSHFFITFS